MGETALALWEKQQRNHLTVPGGRMEVVTAFRESDRQRLSKDTRQTFPLSPALLGTCSPDAEPRHRRTWRLKAAQAQEPKPACRVRTARGREACIIGSQFYKATRNHPPLYVRLCVRVHGAYVTCTQFWTMTCTTEGCTGRVNTMGRAAEILTCWNSPACGLWARFCEIGRVYLSESIRLDLWGCRDVFSWERKQAATTHNMKNSESRRISKALN